MRTFRLTDAHVKLLRAGNYTDHDGTPGLDGKRPFGNGDVWSDMHRILLGLDLDELGDEAQTALVYGFYKPLLEAELTTAMQIVMRTGAFEPGEYVANEYSNDWTRKEKTK